MICSAIPTIGRKHPSEFRLQRVLEALQAENTPGFGRTLWDPHIVFRRIKILLAPSKATGGCAEFAQQIMCLLRRSQSLRAGRV
jgi:hypothetical protein